MLNHSQAVLAFSIWKPSTQRFRLSQSTRRIAGLTPFPPWFKAHQRRRLHGTWAKAFHVLPRRLSLKIMPFSRNSYSTHWSLKENVILRDLVTRKHLLSFTALRSCVALSCRWRGSLFVHVRHAAREAWKKVSTISRLNRNAHKGVSHSGLCQILGVKLVTSSTFLATTPPQHLDKFCKCMSHVYTASTHIFWELGYFLWSK